MSFVFPPRCSRNVWDVWTCRKFGEILCRHLLRFLICPGGYKGKHMRLWPVDTSAFKKVFFLEKQKIRQNWVTYLQTRQMEQKMKSLLLKDVWEFMHLLNWKEKMNVGNKESNFSVIVFVSQLWFNQVQRKLYSSLRRSSW